MQRFIDALTMDGPVDIVDRGIATVAKAARTGIQLYAGPEVGKPDMPVVRVYRPADEVFSDASLASYSHAPVTLDHPPEMVTPENWSKYGKGEVSTAAKLDRKSGWVSLPLIVKSQDAIDAVNAGKRQLSAGYTCRLDWTPGTTAGGEAYDAIQRDIAINHLAIVDRARAGSEARIGDKASWGATPISAEDARNQGFAPVTPKKEDEMSDTLKTVVLGDKAVQVSADSVAEVENFKAASAKTLTDAKADHDKAIAAKDAEIAKKDAEIDALKGKVLDGAALDAAVAARGDLVAKAKAIAPDVKTDGLSDAAIRKAVVVAKLGDTVKDKADAYIDARFDILAEDAAASAGLANAITQRPASVGDAAAYQKALADSENNINARFRAQ